MTAEADKDRSKQAELEKAAREAHAMFAAEQAKREVLEKALRDAQANAAAERARREAAEEAARQAQVQASAEHSAKESALQAAQESAKTAAAERASREAGEKALHEASVRSAADRSQRDAAVKAAREAESFATSEKIAREAAEKTARESNTRADAEREGRETAEAALRQSTAGQGHAAAQSNSPLAPPPVPQDKQPAKSLASASPPPAKSIASASAPPATSIASASPPPATSPPAAPPPPQAVRNWLVPIAIIAAAAILFVLIQGSWTTFENSVSVKTDDAYIRADLAPLSTKSTGIVKSTAVNDFQKVKAGEVLVELKNDEYTARVEQAQEAISQAKIKLADMKDRKEQQDARVAQAKTALESSKTGVSQADDTIHSAEATIQEAWAAIDGARASIIQSQAAVNAAEADVTRAAAERERQESLLAEESTTRAKVEVAVNDHERAKANLVGQKAAQAKARAELATRQAQLSKANEQLASSRSEKSKSLLLVTNHEAELTAQIKQRELLDGDEKQLASDLISRQAALTTAKVDFDYTIIRAPADGTVGELKVKPGQLVSAGTQVITMISAKPWVIANYRETQLTKVREGDPASIDIDALPGTHLKGHVDKIAPASGAEFSLLPPDNASGNFTKITQRIQVKIALDGDQESLAKLRPGMSATVTIAPAGAK